MAKHFRYSRERKLPLPRLLAAGIPLIFILSMLTPAVFASGYTVLDGTRTFSVRASDARGALASAGVELGLGDSYVAEHRRITVNRADTVELVCRGAPMEVPIGEETFGQLLARLKIRLEDSDVLSHPRQEKLRDGMVLRVDRITRQEESYSETLPRPLQECGTAELPKGCREVLSPGADGELRCSAIVTYVNGQETTREVLHSQISRPAAPALIARGTAPSAEASGAPIIREGSILLPSGEVLTYSDTVRIRATAYTHTDAGCNMVTSTGSRVRVGTVAVDPRFIPYGTRMFIAAEDGSYIYGIAQAEDCGGDIVGDRVDLYLPTYEDCIAFGRRTCTAYILGNAGSAR